MLTVIKTAKRSSPRKQRQTTKVVTVSPILRKTKNRSSGQSARSKTVSAYARTLCDPFEYPGIPLGYDTFLPTTMGTAYVRNVATVASDGSFSITLFPEVSKMVTFCNAVSGAVRSTSLITYAASNASYFTNNFTEARVVSGGLRVMCLFPETSASGVLLSGTAADLSKYLYNNLTTTLLAGFPGSRLGLGSKGSAVTLRPYDNASFELFVYPVQSGGYADTVLPYVTSGYICGQGFPAGTQVWFEAVLNIEGLAQSQGGCGLTPEDDIVPPNTTNSFFPTPGELLSTVQSYLTPSVVMDSVDVASMYASKGPSAAIGLAGIKASKHLFGTGRNRPSSSNYMASVPSIMDNGARVTEIMREEQKEAIGGGWHLTPR